MKCPECGEDCEDGWNGWYCDDCGWQENDDGFGSDDTLDEEFDE